MDQTEIIRVYYLLLMSRVHWQVIIKAKHKHLRYHRQSHNGALITLHLNLIYFSVLKYSSYVILSQCRRQDKLVYLHGLYTVPVGKTSILSGAHLLTALPSCTISPDNAHQTYVRIVIFTFMKPITSGNKIVERLKILIHQAVREHYSCGMMALTI